MKEGKKNESLIKKRTRKRNWASDKKERKKKKSLIKKKEKKLAS